MLTQHETPFPWRKLKEIEVTEHRMLDCPRYKECLTLAASRYWEGWTCIFCDNYKEVKKECP